MSESKEKSYDEKNKEVMIKIDKNLMEGKRNGLECLDEIKKLTELVSGKGDPKKVITILFPIIESMNLDLLGTIIPKIGGGPVIDTEIANAGVGEIDDVRKRDLREDAEKEELDEEEQKELVSKLEITMKKEDERLVSLYESSIKPGELPKALRGNKIAIFQAGLGITGSIATLGLIGYFGLGPKDDESLKGLVGKTGGVAILGAAAFFGTVPIAAAAVSASVMAAYILLPKMGRLISHFRRKGEIYEWFKDKMSLDEIKNEIKYLGELDYFVERYVEGIQGIIDQLADLRLSSSYFSDYFSDYFTEETFNKFRKHLKEWAYKKIEDELKEVKDKKAFWKDEGRWKSKIGWLGALIHIKEKRSEDEKFAEAKEKFEMWKEDHPEECRRVFKETFTKMMHEQFTTYCEKAGIPQKFRATVLLFALVSVDNLLLFSVDEETIIQYFKAIYKCYMQQYLYHYLKVVYYDKAYLLHQICSSSNLLKGVAPEKWFETLERYRKAGQLKGLLDDLERQFLASVDTKREKLKSFVKKTDKKGQGFEIFSDNIMRMLVYGDVPMDKWVPLLENLTEDQLNGFYETVKSEESKRVVELKLYKTFENKRGRGRSKMGDEKKVVGVREVKDAQTGALRELVYEYGRIKKNSSEDFLMIYQKTQLNRELQVFEQAIDVKSKTKGSLGKDHLTFLKGRIEDVNGVLTKGEFRQCISRAEGNEAERNKLMKVYIENSSKLKLSEETKTTKIDAEIHAYKAKKESLENEAGYATTDSQRSSIKRNSDSIQAKISELTSKKATHVKEKEEYIEDITKLFTEQLSGKYSGGYDPQIYGGLDMEPILKRLLGEELKTLQDFSSIADRLKPIIDKRVKIGKNIESLKLLERTKDTFETGSDKKIKYNSKFHIDLHRKFTNRFGEEIGKRLFDRVFSKVVMRNRSIDNNLATLFDENRKDDLNRVLLNENDTTRVILQELCKEYKDNIEKNEIKKKEKEEKQKQAKEKAIKMGEKGSIPGKEEDIDVSGVTSSISGLATSAYDKLAGLTGMVKDEKDKMSKDTLSPDLKTVDLQLKEVKSDKRSYKPKDHKPEDLTTITRKELDELQGSEETLRKQLEMDRAIIRQYKQNIEHDISEHYKVLKMKEEQLLQKSDYVLREQQKVVAYYMGVLQNRESIILEQEKVLEMKRKRELEEIEELRAKIQHQLIKELEKEKKLMMKHHNKQMRKQKSLLQTELKEYTGDNLYLTRLARSSKSDKGSLKKEKEMVVQKSFLNAFVY